jgi:pimeloyl-ACP methyl ester carboxylesterase
MECLGDLVQARQDPPQAHQRRTADRLKGRWHELDTGHYPMLTEPEALARLIADG